VSEPLDPQLTALGRALAGLAPAPPALDRDRLLYEAGRAAAPPRPWGWVTAAAFAALVLGSWVTPEAQRVAEVRVVERLPAKVTPPDAPESPPARASFAALPGGGPAGGYLRLRNQVVAWGPDALPAALSPAATPPAHADIRWKPTTDLRGDF
jgi:hypothetical protein